MEMNPLKICCRKVLNRSHEYQRLRHLWKPTDESMARFWVIFITISVTSGCWEGVCNGTQFMVEKSSASRRIRHPELLELVTTLNWTYRRADGQSQDSNDLMKTITGYKITGVELELIKTTRSSWHPVFRYFLGPLTWKPWKLIFDCW